MHQIVSGGVLGWALMSCLVACSSQSSNTPLPSATSVAITDSPQPPPPTPARRPSWAPRVVTPESQLLVSKSGLDWARVIFRSEGGREPKFGDAGEGYFDCIVSIRIPASSKHAAEAVKAGLETALDDDHEACSFGPNFRPADLKIHPDGGLEFRGPGLRLEGVHPIGDWGE